MSTNLRRLAFWIFVVLLAPVLLAQPTIDQFRRADSLATRLRPTSFPSLPKPIQDYLVTENYLIPQSWSDSIPHNVISGQFQKQGQLDWAVLASKNRTSSIIIFWNGSTKDASHIESRPDINFMQDEADRGILFSRLIQTVSADQVRFDCSKDYEPQTFKIDHDGIDDYFIPKASQVLFYTDGVWQYCTGAD